MKNANDEYYYEKLLRYSMVVILTTLMFSLLQIVIGAYVYALFGATVFNFFIGMIYAVTALLILSLFFPFYLLFKIIYYKIDKKAEGLGNNITTLIYGFAFLISIVLLNDIERPVIENQSAVVVCIIPIVALIVFLIFDYCSKKTIGIHLGAKETKQVIIKNKNVKKLLTKFIYLILAIIISATAISFYGYRSYHRETVDIYLFQVDFFDDLSSDNSDLVYRHITGDQRTIALQKDSIGSYREYLNEKQIKLGEIIFIEDHIVNYKLGNIFTNEGLEISMNTKVYFEDNKTVSFFATIIKVDKTWKISKITFQQ